MPNRIVVGTQWGDEGKAKIVDYLAEKADIVVRFQGGANAGHTVIVNDNKFIFHLIPSGILHQDKVCVIGNGVVFDYEEFFNEIEAVAANGISVEGRLFVSSRAHLVMPFHKEFDRVREKSLGKGKIGTTRRGIGPAYADKVARIGLRVADLLWPDIFREKVEASLFEKNYLLQKAYEDEPMDVKKICDQYLAFADKLKPYICETSYLLNQSMRQGKSILFEGAQGTFLDIDHGTYPFVTSSNTVAGGACSGAGVGPTRIDEVVGVVKVYTTRVGNGPFPTEFDEEKGSKIRELGGEYGATTGRPRRCGWLDSVMLRKAVDVNGLDTIALTKLDVLDSLDEIKIATAYKIGNETINCFPSCIDDLEVVEPVYETLPGWKCATSECRNYNDLPKNAKKYVTRISELTNTKIGLVSVGGQRSRTIEMGL